MDDRHEKRAREHNDGLEIANRIGSHRAMESRLMTFFSAAPSSPGSASWIVRAASACLLFILLGACKPGAPDPAALAQGRVLYAQHCAACHGANLEGQPNWRERLPNGRLPAPPHDESGHTWHHPDEVLFAITKFGLVPPHAPAGYESEMPAFKDKLSDAEIRAVLAYIASQWSSPHVLAARAEMLRNARR